MEHQDPMTATQNFNHSSLIPSPQKCPKDNYLKIVPKRMNITASQESEMRISHLFTRRVYTFVATENDPQK
jgi:hypothetical protein